MSGSSTARNFFGAALAMAVMATFGFVIGLPPDVGDSAQRLDEAPKSLSEVEFNIIAAVLRDYRFEGAPPPPPLPGEFRGEARRQQTIFEPATIRFCDDRKTMLGGNCRGESINLFLRSPHDELISSEVRAKLVEANLEQRIFPCIAGEWHICGESDRLAVLFESGDWEPFYSIYSGSAGVVQASAPVLSDARDQALVLVSHRCGGLCGTGALFVLERVGTSWRVIYRREIWVS